MSHRILLIVLVMLVGVSSAQDTDWYYAIDFDAETVIAYTLDGEVRVLLEDIEDVVQPFVRFNNGKLLLNGGEGGIYLVDGDTAEAVDLTGAFPLAVGVSHVVLADSPRVGDSPLMLLNFETGQVEMLTGIIPTFLFERCCRFSDDGEFLYYPSSADEGETWVLLQRELATGTEESVYVFESGGRSPLVASSSYGDYWLYRTAGADGEYVVFTPDEELARLSQRGENDEAFARFIFDDNLITVDLRCETDCTFTVDSLADGSSWSFDLPTSIPIDVFTQPSPNSLLLGQREALWSIFVGQSPREIGYHSPQHLGLTYRQLLSPDENWFFALDDATSPTAYRIWDVNNRRLVVNESYDALFLLAFYGQGGVVVSDTQEFTHLYLYSAIDEKIELPMPDRGRYIDVISDDTGLVLDFEVGISVFNFVTGEETLLVEGERLRPLTALKIG